MHFFCQKICACQKKAVLLRTFLLVVCNNEQKSIGPDGGIGRRAGLKHQWSNPCRFDPGSGYVARVAAKCVRPANGSALLSLLFPKNQQIFGDPGREWFAEVRSLCERRRLTFPPFPQNLLQSFWGPRKEVARRSAFALRTEAPYSRSFSPKPLAELFWGEMGRNS